MIQPLVSIIVPVYNAARYLARCVQSILSQTVTSIEVILVDDGSTDESGAIADSFAEKDKRISVYHKPNAGVSHTRNFGLSHAKGEWVSFVDSDDALSPVFLEELLKTVMPETDFCLCNFTMTNGEGNDYLYETFHPGKSREETISNLYKCGWMFSIGILFRRSFLTDHQLRFPEHLHYTEDVWFTTRAVFYAQHISKTKQPLYCYNTGNQSSLTHKSQNEAAETMRLDSMAETILFLQKNHSFNQCRKAIYWRILVWKSWMALFPQQYERFNDRFVEANAYIGTNPFLSLKMKIMLWLLGHRLFFPAKMLYHLYER